MTKKNLTAGNGAGCQECSKAISGEALRCTECDKVMHLTCSRLPDYSLAMYIITRNQYLCAACVEKRGDKDSIFADTMAKVASLKKAECDASPPALDDTITESLEGFENGLHEVFVLFRAPVYGRVLPFFVRKVLFSFRLKWQKWLSDRLSHSI